MTTQTVNKVMRQRLNRGTPVIVTDSLSFGQAKLRGKHMVVTSKGPVPCNKKGRCAGDWCIGLAVFVASEKTAKQDKKMGWRKGTAKICLTHIKDKDGVLVVPPPLLRTEEPAPVLPSRIKDLVPPPLNGNGNGNGASVGEGSEVTWDDLANAARAENFSLMTVLARRLKSQTEGLKNKVIASQARLIESLTGK